MSTRLIRMKEVISKTGLSRSRIYQYIGEGRFPASLSLGGRSVCWIESEVDKWIANTIEQRGNNILYGYDLN